MDKWLFYLVQKIMVILPASLLYALLFTLSFQFAYEKQSVIRNLINKEVNLLYETLNLSHNFSSKDEFQSTLIRLQIAKVVHDQALDLVEQIKGLCLSSQQQQMLKMSSSLEDSSLRGGASSQQTSQTRKNRMDKIAKKGGKMETSQKKFIRQKIKQRLRQKIMVTIALNSEISVDRRQRHNQQHFIKQNYGHYHGFFGRGGLTTCNNLTKIKLFLMDFFRGLGICYIYSGVINHGRLKKIRTHDVYVDRIFDFLAKFGNFGRR
eukprot:TRINITY_DN8219_c0_g1_i2.p2 TRINITY_DN8219_c0_g1~~TRINITY_DN8219_c0_g1_i2.p2  ORF type:complete len:281 (-),score=13.26 TRINITY_DN8219_c0_g1_i2:250-1041(-)